MAKPVIKRPLRTGKANVESNSGMKSEEVFSLSLVLLLDRMRTIFRHEG